MTALKNITRYIAAGEGKELINLEGSLGEKHTPHTAIMNNRGTKASTIHSPFLRRRDISDDVRGILDDIGGYGMN